MRILRETNDSDPLFLQYLFLLNLLFLFLRCRSGDVHHGLVLILGVHGGRHGVCCTYDCTGGEANCHSRRSCELNVGFAGDKVQRRMGRFGFPWNEMLRRLRWSRYREVVGFWNGHFALLQASCDLFLVVVPQLWSYQNCESVAKREKKRKTVIDRGIDRLRGRRFLFWAKSLLEGSTTDMNGFSFKDLTVKQVRWFVIRQSDIVIEILHVGKSVLCRHSLQSFAYRLVTQNRVYEMKTLLGGLAKILGTRYRRLIGVEQWEAFGCCYSWRLEAITALREGPRRSLHDQTQELIITVGLKSNFKPGREWRCP